MWCVKYRKEILRRVVDKTLQNVIRKIAREHEINIVKMETDGDHIHLLVECTLQQYIPDVMKALKGVSARIIFRTFPTLKSSLWGGY